MGLPLGRRWSFRVKKTEERLNHKYRSEWAHVCTTNTLKYVALQNFLECNQGQLAWNAHKSQVNTKQTDIDPTTFCFSFLFFFGLLFLLVMRVYMKIVLMLYNVLDTKRCFHLKLILNEPLFEVKLTHKTQILPCSWRNNDNVSMTRAMLMIEKNLQFALKYVQCFIQLAQIRLAVVVLVTFSAFRFY